MRVRVKGFSREPHFQQWVSSCHCLDLDLSEPLFPHQDKGNHSTYNAELLYNAYVSDAYPVLGTLKVSSTWELLVVAGSI